MLTQLCARPTEGHRCWQLLCSLTVSSCQQHTPAIAQLATMFQGQQQISTSTAAQTKQQPAPQSAATKELFKPQQDVLRKIEAAQPTQPQMQLLRTVLSSEDPLTSHELFARVQQEYGNKNFPSRGRFKQYLQSMMRRKWVAAKPPAVKGAKGESSYVFVGTPLGCAVDLEAPAHGLQAVAQVKADAWTRKHLPQYAEHMSAGRVPVTAHNLGVLEPMERPRLFKAAMFGSNAAKKHRAAEAAVTPSSQGSRRGGEAE